MGFWGSKKGCRGSLRDPGGPLIFSEFSRIFTFLTPRGGRGGVIKSFGRKLPGLTLHSRSNDKNDTFGLNTHIFANQYLKTLLVIPWLFGAIFNA